MRYDLGLGSLTTDGSISLLYLFTSATIPNGSLNFLILLTSSDFLSSLFISDFLSSLDLFISSIFSFYFFLLFCLLGVKTGALCFDISHIDPMRTLHSRDWMVYLGNQT